MSELEDGAAQDARWLPGGKAVLFRSPDGIEVLDLGSRNRTWLLEGHTPHYARSGHLGFARGATLWAVPFDPVTLEMKGDPVPMGEDVRRSHFNGTAYFQLSANGTLAYPPGRDAPTGSLVWVDAEGRTTPAFEDRAPLPAPPALVGRDEGARHSRAGRQRVGRVAPGPGSRGPDAADPGRDERLPGVVFGRRATLFSATGSGRSGLFTVPIDGTGSPQLHLETASTLHWADWSGDGLFVVFGPAASGDLSLRDDGGEVALSSTTVTGTGSSRPST